MLKGHIPKNGAKIKDMPMEYLRKNTAHNRTNFTVSLIRNTECPVDSVLLKLVVNHETVQSWPKKFNLQIA